MMFVRIAQCARARDPFRFFDPWFQAPVIVSDTAMISMSLLLARAGQESFLFFFFVLIMAAKVESMVTLGICAVLIGCASFLLGNEQAGWASPTLMRVPFTFATALFFGYVVLPERSGVYSGHWRGQSLLTASCQRGGRRSRNAITPSIASGLPMAICCSAVSLRPTASRVSH
jgi:hypothetical protein